MQDRIIDLMEPFKKKQYVHPGFEGSASIKKVLPILIPDLSYKNLAIQEGGTASATYADLKNQTLEVQKTQRKDLLD